MCIYVGMGADRALALEAAVDARRLAPRAAELSAQAERDRRLAPELVSALADRGLFRLCVPAAIGGLEAHPAVLVEVVAALARGDGAAGWCVAIGATSGLLAGYLPEDAAREISGNRRAISGGVFAPKGCATVASGGFRVSGRWPFASGCQDCDWLMGGCVVEEDGHQRKLANGMPDVRLMLAPADEFRIHDTWDVMGLRGTGSHDIELDDVPVPPEHSASVFTDSPVQPGPLYAFPLFGLLAIAIAAVGLGLARGAIDDLVDLAGAKTPTGSGRKLAERATVQAAIAQAEASLRAAQALLGEAIDEAWSGAGDQGQVTTSERAGLRMAATHSIAVAVSVVESAYRLGGGSSIYQSSRLQRRLRDVNVAAQHMLVAPATWELTGRLLLGLPTDTSQL